MQVLIDGRSVYLPSTGGVSWDDLPIGMNEIDRIEVIRGPNGVTYGVNSFQAVINIITLHSGATYGNEYSLISAGPKEYNAGLRIGGKNGALDYRINLQYEVSDGFDDSIEFSEEQNDDRDTLKLNIRTDYQVGVNDSLNLSLGYTTGAREVGFTDGGLSSIQEQQLDPVHDQQVTSSYQHLKFQHIISSEQEVNLQIYHNVHNLKNSYQTALVSELLTSHADTLSADDPDTWAFFSGGDDIVTTAEFNAAMQFLAIDYQDQSINRDGSLFDERLGVELNHLLRLGKEIRAVWGGELRQDRFRGNDWVNSGETFTNNSQRLFFNGEWSPAERWAINVGDMAEKSDYMDMKHSPRLTVNWDVAKRHYIRVGYSRAWRSPTFIESEFDYSLVLIPDTALDFQLFLNNEELRPERIDVKEIAFGGSLKSRGITYELRLFQEDMEDILVISNDPALDYSVVTNDGYSHVNGSELALTLYLSQPGPTLRIGYSRLNPSGEIKSDYTPVDIAHLVPEETMNILFSQKVAKGGMLGVSIYRVSSMKFIAGDSGNSFTTANISYQQPVNILGHKTKMSVAVQDFLGSYYDFEKEVVTQSQIYLGIKGDF